MSNIAIEFNNVGKQYRLGRVGTGTLSHDLNRWFQTSILRREDPYLKIGETNDRTKKGDSDYVWALRDISFQVEQGDVVGIIGKNGAGKSTLLKLLSHITSPSTGSIRYKGRIASLLEVGTGFHPELTGRENIYMNGSIMGMTKAEITHKLDEIVDFAGVERYLDTPVKRYSSGMTVRLGFAVAAFLEPEILVVDEVLTVGDAEFQKKAIGKMNDVATNGGRTVLFVSHNMDSVRSLCKHGIVLNNGLVEMVGTSDNCVDFYMQTSVDSLVGEVDAFNYHHDYPGRELEITHVKMLNDNSNLSIEEPLCFKVDFRRNVSSIMNTQIGVYVHDSSGAGVVTAFSDMFSLFDTEDEYSVEFELPKHQLAKGTYSVDFSLSQFDFSAVPFDYDFLIKPLSFEIRYVDQEHKIPFVGWQPRLGAVATKVDNVKLTII